LFWCVQHNAFSVNRIKITLIDTNVTLYNSQDLSELLNYSAIALYLNK